MSVVDLEELKPGAATGHRWEGRLPIRREKSRRIWNNLSAASLLSPPSWIRLLGS